MPRTSPGVLVPLHQTEKNMASFPPIDELQQESIQDKIRSLTTEQILICWERVQMVLGSMQRALPDECHLEFRGEHQIIMELLRRSVQGESLAGSLLPHSDDSIRQPAQK